MAVMIVAGVAGTLSTLSSTFTNFESEELSSGAVFFVIFLYFIYHPLFESLSTQGSIGKLVCKLAVVNAAGARISFMTALGRNLAKILSGMVCYLGFLNVLWDSQAQGWHDKMANAYIIKKDAY